MSNDTTTSTHVPEVFLVMTTECLQDCNPAEFHSVYATREAAEAKAAILRREHFEYHFFTKYDLVEVVAQPLLS